MTAMITEADGLEQLIEISRFYGRDPDFTLGGGGNTSFKTDDVLQVKASGFALSTISAEGFVRMDRGALDALLASDLPESPEAREEAFKNAIMAARLSPELGQRPSVECAIHHLLPSRFVVHTHSTLVNMVACSVGGEETAKKLFGENVLWIPYVDPGVTLARQILKQVKEYTRATGRSYPPALVLANHGLIVCGETPEEIHATTNGLIESVTKAIRSAAAKQEQKESDLRTAIPLLRGALAEAHRPPMLHLLEDEEVAAFLALSDWRTLAERGPMTPDQIVYCGSYPLVVGRTERSAEGFRTQIDNFRQSRGESPRVVILEGLGLVGVGRSAKDARTVAAVYRDAMRVMRGAAALGGVSYLSDAHRTFIETWEVEAYRKKISLSGSGAGRMSGRIAVVTGAAQGFGLEIAQGLAREGACVLLADINADGAAQAAAELCAELGAPIARGVAMNVTDASTITRALEVCLREWGGIDLFVANAGVLRAGSVKTLPEQDFDFVTSVNYKGYFLCVQAVAPIMAAQNKTAPGVLSDIIQINSKSGLAGSNKNGAYAGAKFGGIGLTQSFALELIEDGIKVNSVCPGNFFDGPLWSDPEKGLFVQYLKAGKVPGAKTIADVKRFYEEKVPMRRGCESLDVIRAILYLVEQQYETGQALPVTGGQVMLN